jgi:AcrR family transcriptional regulator
MMIIIGGSVDTRKRRARQSAKKSRIVAVASRLAVKKGLDGFSLTAVAREAGISKGTLYYYYPTKSELIFDIAARHVNEITALIMEMIAASGPDAEPVDLLSLFFRKHQANRTRMRLHLNLVYQAMNGDQALKQRYQAIYTRWRRQARQALETLLPDSPHLETLLHLIITTIDGLNVQSMLEVDPAPTERIAAFLVNAAR